MLVAVIAGFILLMTAAGILLAYLLNDPENGLEANDDDDDADAQGNLLGGVGTLFTFPI